MTYEQPPLFDDSFFYSPMHDTVLISGKAENGEPLELDGYLLLNGERRQRAEYPEFEALKDEEDLFVTTLEGFPMMSNSCPFCAQHLHAREENYHNPFIEPGELDGDGLFVMSRLEHCRGCGFWQFSELRNATLIYRTEIFDSHELTTVVSKLRAFNEVPEDALNEIAQWFKRHPSLYQSVNPSYLEKLVGRIFAASGNFAEVLHVGRPDDGGVDLVLVEDENSTWLVQVKRREAADASEAVQTVRNLLGAMVLNESRFGIVVSTADHFTYRAHEAAKKASGVGYRVDLMDRHVLDRLLSGSLPKAPWTQVVARINSERKAWFRESQWT
jgi:hypothetical protein